MDDQVADLATAWRGIVQDLQAHQRAWLLTSEPVTLHESTAIIAVPNDFTRNQLENRLRAQLEDSLSETFGREIRLAVTVNPALDTIDPVVDEVTSRSDDMSTIALAPQQEAEADVLPLPREHEAPADRRATALETRLNPKYTFETFVI
ncbi:MAG: chromosomal replication initiation protein DnaA, partial [Nocardioides sp.]|nr:chromosomal replication initiation protein DnaA [Nocardioides sp.]